MIPGSFDYVRPSSLDDAVSALRSAGDDGKVLAIEVKLAATVEDRDTTHLHWLAGHLGENLLDAIVINTGPHAYRRPDGIGVVPLALLGP